MKSGSNIFLHLIIGLVFISCKKDALPVQPDYRDRYVGSYKGILIEITETYNAFADTTYVDSIITNNKIITFTKRGAYPSQEISMDGWAPFKLQIPTKDGAIGSDGWKTIHFKFPTVSIGSYYNPTGDKGFTYYFNGVKQ